MSEQMLLLEKRVSRLEGKAVDEALLKQREEELIAANKLADHHLVQRMELQKVVFDFLHEAKQTGAHRALMKRFEQDVRRLS